jgi:hypothetical protein
VILIAIGIDEVDIVDRRVVFVLVFDYFQKDVTIAIDAYHDVE